MGSELNDTHSLIQCWTDDYRGDKKDQNTAEVGDEEIERSKRFDEETGLGDDKEATTSFVPGKKQQEAGSSSNAEKV